MEYAFAENMPTISKTQNSAYYNNIYLVPLTLPTESGIYSAI